MPELDDTESRENHPEKDPMGSFSNPFGAARAGFDNRCRIKRVQGLRACGVIRGTISDCIVPTLLTLTKRAVLVKGPLICINRVPRMAKVNILRYAHLLNQFRVNKGQTHVEYHVYRIASPYLPR